MADLTTTIPSGRVEVEGIITGQKGDWKSPHGWSMMVTTDAGWRVWVTRPRPFDGHYEGIVVDHRRDWDDPGRKSAGVPVFPAAKGDRVRFTAHLTPKDDTFAFGSRPTNAVILERTTEPNVDLGEDWGGKVNLHHFAIQVRAEIAVAQQAYDDYGHGPADATLDEVFAEMSALSETLVKAKARLSTVVERGNIDTGPVQYA